MFSYRGDLFIEDARLWVDPGKPRDCAFISHAHGDHIGRHDHIFATPATARILEHRLGPLRITRIGWDDEIEIRPGVTLRVHPAGHILGSAQLEIRARRRTLVYSGDIKLRPSATAEPCRVVPCDVLVMETTYGRPHYRFPPREQVVPQLVEALRKLLGEGKTPILLAYTLGRSQELLKILEPHGFDLRLAPPAFAMARVYEELGQRFGPYQLARPGETDGAVVFVPPHGSRSKLVRRARSPVLIAATGWALDGHDGPPYRTDFAYPLSDHADFDELVEYVDRAAPKEVYTTHGFPEFLQHLRARGVTALPLDTRVAMR